MLAEIDKEERIEEIEEVVENEQEFLFDDEIDVNSKIKRKRDTGSIMFDDLEAINLIEDDKKFLETKQQQYVKEFVEFTNNDFLYKHNNIYEPD
jgi:hypothetical protein